MQNRTCSARSGSEPTRLRDLYGLPRPSSLNPPHTALVLVDLQNEFVTGGLRLPAAPAAITHAAELARWARQAGILVSLVENVIDRPDAPLFAAGAKNTEIVPQLTPQHGDLVRARTWPAHSPTPTSTNACAQAASTP